MKQFSPHIYPEWGELIYDLPVERQAEIFNAILKYPNENPDSGVWRFIKSQIDKDYDLFIERCQKNGDISRNYWHNKTISNDTERLPNDNQSISNDTLNVNINNKREHKQQTNNVNEKYIYLGELKNVKLTQEEYDKLQEKYTNLGEAIEKLDTWLGTSGSKNKGKDHYAYFKENSWVWERIKPSTNNNASAYDRCVKNGLDTMKKFEELGL
jgi:hypothetical protein